MLQRGRGPMPHGEAVGYAQPLARGSEIAMASGAPGSGLGRGRHGEKDERMRGMRYAAIGLALALGACGQGARQETTEVAAGTPPPAFAVCSSCHAVTPGRNTIGPSLAGVWQRKAGSMPGYTYSPALKGSGIVWDAQSLDRWLEAPMQMVPGTKMVVGLPNPEARKAVIEYLQTLK